MANRQIEFAGNTVKVMPEIEEFDTEVREPEEACNAFECDCAGVKCSDCLLDKGNVDYLIEYMNGHGRILKGGVRSPETEMPMIIRPQASQR